MYQPKKYQLNAYARQWDFIAQHPFGTMVQQINGELIATHIPLLIWQKDDQQILHGHLARHNAQSQCVDDGQTAMFIFQESRGYFSPPEEIRPEIGTWDYSAVHVYARLKVLTRDELHQSVAELTAFFEASRPNPYPMSELPKDMVEDHLDRIIGFVAEPYKIQGIEKKHF
jgi:transcriptional regulator